MKRNAMGRVRPLDAEDLGEVVDLHRRVVGARGAASRPSRGDFERIFLHHPWQDEGLPSLVYEDGSGRIAGCLGVMPRPMWFDGRKITMAISHNFIVEPGSRSTLAGMQLAMRFLSGPQDLSMAEGSSVSRRIWERAGGATSLLHSLNWTRPLNPARYLLSVLRNRGLPKTAARALHPICRLADAVLSLVPLEPFRTRRPDAPAEKLDGPAMRACLSEYEKDRLLRPCYDDDGARWLLETLERKAGAGRFCGAAVRNASGEDIGWYVYAVNANGTAEVAQMGARPGAAGPVFEHLFYHAKKRGAVAVSGRVDPALFQWYSGEHCFFHHDGRSWILIHSKRPELLQAIHSGDACLTRLEGEWWISFLLR